jgi:chemotaxis protein MotB
MAAQANAAPVIIKRKKVIKGGGHHGGAWKVAYADFVTAMMAFFMLMWLLNATTEQQRKGISDYFSPTIPIVRVSGGGDGAFSGESIFSEMTLPKNGTGATTPDQPADGQEGAGAGNGSDGPDAEGQNELFKVVDSTLMGRGGESMVMDELKRHVITKVTDEGMVIELFDDDEMALFTPGTDEASPLLDKLLYVIADAAKIVESDIAVAGYVRSNPIVAIKNPVWDLSSQRATQGRLLLEKYLGNPERVKKVTGYADRKPAVTNSMDIRNNRLQVILLRE